MSRDWIKAMVICAQAGFCDYDAFGGEFRKLVHAIFEALKGEQTKAKSQGSPKPGSKPGSKSNPALERAINQLNEWIETHNKSVDLSQQLSLVDPDDIAHRLVGKNISELIDTTFKSWIKEQVDSAAPLYLILESLEFMFSSSVGKESFTQYLDSLKLPRFSIHVGNFSGGEISKANGLDESAQLAITGPCSFDSPYMDGSVLAKPGGFGKGAFSAWINDWQISGTKPNMGKFYDSRPCGVNSNINFVFSM